MTQDSTYETDVSRFQAVLSRPQSQLSQTHFGHGSFEHYPTHDPNAVAAMHEYNGSQGSTLAHQMHQSQIQPQYGLLTGIHQNGYYVQPIVPHETGYAPIGLGPESRTGTPQLAQGGNDPDRKDKKSATTTAANEKELRELLEKNEHRNLESIARDVRQAERTQKSERAKQLFAMRWSVKMC